MGIRTPLASEEFYHLYNRGTEKRKIFLTKKDHERFLALLYVANGTESVRLDNLSRSEQGSTLLNLALEEKRGKPLVSIGAYCLMPNHFHLLVKQRADAGISRFMQKLSTAYTMYFNKRYRRTGTLFQGKFKSEHADSDNYLKYLFAYIHLNPTKITLPKTYDYSSYRDYTNDRPQGAILDKSGFPNYFKTSKEFEREMHDWLKYREDSAANK